MHDPHTFLVALTVVLCTAGVTTVLFQRLKQPVILGYILAGLIVGPHVPIPLIADRHVVETLSELGVILLMFSIGLEFSPSKLFSIGPSAAVIALVQSSIMVWLGYLTGQAFGWTAHESLFTGAIVAISSTTIIAKAFDEQGITGRLRELVVAELIVEDLIAIVLMALLTAFASGDDLSAGTLLRSSGRLAAFLIGLMVVGLLLVPRSIRAIQRLQRPETTLVASIGLCFAVALLASSFGYSVALGAFLAGSLIAESGEGKQVGQLIVPVRDMFAAVFFVSVGMLIEPAVIAEHFGAIAALTLLVIVGKLVGVSFGAFLTGNGTRTSLQAGLSLGQIGEFSFIIAGLGISLKATGDFLYPVAAAVSALTTLTTPWSIRAAGPVASFVDRKLPRSWQTFVALYGSWIEQMRSVPAQPTTSARVRRLIGLLALDAAILATIVIGTSLQHDALAQQLGRRLQLSPELLSAATTAGAGLLSLPFLVGVVRLARSLALALADAAFPNGNPAVAAPRRALMVTLQLAAVLLVALLLLALTQPFLPRLPAAISLLVVLLALGISFARSTADLQGHVTAGAGMVVEALVGQARKRERSLEEQLPAPIQQALAALGEPTPVRIEEASVARGKTLAELDLRGLTGATVLAIIRGDQHVLVPGAHDRLALGDILALAGTHEAVAAATRLLAPPAAVAVAVAEA